MASAIVLVVGAFFFEMAAASKSGLFAGSCSAIFFVNIFRAFSQLVVPARSECAFRQACCPQCTLCNCSVGIDRGPL